MNKYSVNPITPTLFSDYQFRIDAEGSIIWDSALTPEQLYVRSGDRFVVVIQDGVIVFRRESGGRAGS